MSGFTPKADTCSVSACPLRANSGHGPHRAPLCVRRICLAYLSTAMSTNTVIATIAMPTDPTTLAHHNVLVARGGRRLKGGNRNATHATAQATQASTKIGLVNSTSPANKNIIAYTACHEMNATPIPRAG